MITKTEIFKGCIYLTTNLINNKQYIGQCHRPNRVKNGSYKGSGSSLIKAFEKYGWDNFKTTIIEHVETNSKENLKKLLDEKEISLIKKHNTFYPNGYNISSGGRTTAGLIPVRDKYGNTFSVKFDDSRYLNGELVHVSTGFSLSEETKFKISQRLLENGSSRGENNSMFGKHHSKKTKAKISEKLSGKLVVVDKNGKKFSVSKNDERYLNGELVSYSKVRKFNKQVGIINVRDKNGNKFRVSNKDEKYLNGELVYVGTGRILSEDTKYKISKTLQNREKITCPHCSFACDVGNARKWHFNKCKHKNNIAIYEN